MTTAPKLIREQLLALTAKWRITQHALGQGSAGNKARQQCADQLEEITRSLAAEPVGGERLMNALIGCTEHMEHSTPQGAAAWAEAHAIILESQPDSAEGDPGKPQRCADGCSPLTVCDWCQGSESNDEQCATDEWKGEVESTASFNRRMREFDLAQERAAQPKAEGVSPTDVAYRMADRNASRLSAAPQPEPVMWTGEPVEALRRIERMGGPASYIARECLRRVETQPEQTKGLGCPPGQLHDEVVDFISEHPEDITHQRLVAHGWTPPGSQPEQPARDGVDWKSRYFERRNVIGRWHEKAVELGYDGVADLLWATEQGEPPLHIAELLAKASAQTQPPQQADGGAVLWVSQTSFDWIKEGGDSGYILAFGRPFDSGEHVPLYAAHPPKSPGVGVPWTDAQCAEFMSVAFRHCQISGIYSYEEIRQGMTRAAALGGET